MTFKAIFWYYLNMRNTLVIYLRGGVKYQRVFSGCLTAAQAQRQLLDEKVGCQKILFLKLVWFYETKAIFFASGTSFLALSWASISPRGERSFDIYFSTWESEEDTDWLWSLLGYRSVFQLSVWQVFSRVWLRHLSFIFWASFWLDKKFSPCVWMALLWQEQRNYSCPYLRKDCSSFATGVKDSVENMIVVFYIGVVLYILLMLIAAFFGGKNEWP